MCTYHLHLESEAFFHPEDIPQPYLFLVNLPASHHQETPTRWSLLGRYVVHRDVPYLQLGKGLIPLGSKSTFKLRERHLQALVFKGLRFC